MMEQLGPIPNNRALVPATKRGRPSSYTEEIADAILERLADGETLNAICRTKGMPSERTVRIWARDDVNGFFPRYVRAREIGYLHMADEIVEIADDARNDWMDRETKDGESIRVVDHEHVTRSALRVNTRKWVLAKALPKVFGEKTETTHKHEAGDAFLELLKRMNGIAEPGAKLRVINGGRS